MNKQEYVILARILDRAEKMGIVKRSERIGMAMDIEEVNNLIPLNLEKLLSFSDFDFAHDIHGIYSHYDRAMKEFDDLFVPRCVK